MTLRDPIRYQPYYCEENVWWLCQDPGFAGQERRVVFVSNADRSCLLEHQRAGGDDGQVVWDYHVFLFVNGDDGWGAWDLDTTLGMPVSAAVYLAATFAAGRTVPELAPRFRVIEAERFVAHFASDRSHVRRPDGEWLQPPPAWEPPQADGETMNLFSFVDVERPFVGELFSLDALEARYAGDPGQQKV